MVAALFSRSPLTFHSRNALENRATSYFTSKTHTLKRFKNTLVCAGSTSKDDAETEGALTWQGKREENVWILDRGKNHAIAYKPPSVICHHSEYTGSKAKAKRNEEPTPMLQRVRDALNSNITSPDLMRRVNLVHRLDRGASGCLLFAFASEDKENANYDDIRQSNDEGLNGVEYSPTAALQAALQNATKTYVAIVRGSGMIKGRDLKTEGWFPVHRPIKDESGQTNNATTYFNFVAGIETSDPKSTDPRASLVLARPVTGRWHQVRKHLNGLSHPILGDTAHGSSKTNREWRELRNMPYQRTFLHLARMQLSPTEYTPELDVKCPLPPDFMDMLETHLPTILEDAAPILENEGIELPSPAMLASEYYFGGTSAKDNTELPPMQKRYKEKLEQQKGAKFKDSADYVNILSQGSHFAVAFKPPGVVCHNSAWTGEDEATPMLQRVRNTITANQSSNDTNNKNSDIQYRVNLIHRLDRSASGCLLFSIHKIKDNDTNNEEESERNKKITSSLIEALRSSESTKTYIALVHGTGIHKDEDLTEKGWFSVSSTLTNEHDRLNIHQNATTMFRFISSSSCTTANKDFPATLVLARPQTGQYHQIRKQLSQHLYHPIIGDSSHGYSRTNREWKEELGLLPQRTCLHLTRIQLPSTEFTDEIDVNAPLSMAKDMMDLLEKHFPELLQQSKDILKQEGVLLSI